jgi:pSer/pThr/pTyr-binding forkhead associated (FHA) protein
MGDLPTGPLTSPADLKAQLEAERAGRPFLVYRDGEGLQRLVTLDDARTSLTVGREGGVDVPLEWDAEVSRVHAELRLVGDHWVLSDDGLSRNGTYVNGERLGARRRLHDGDVIRFGRTSVVFRQSIGAGSGGSTVVSTAPLSRSDVSQAQRRVLIALCRPFAVPSAFAIPPGNQEIADELFLSAEAVKTHMRALYAKFGLEDLPQQRKRTRLVELALLTGIVSRRELETDTQ